MKTADKDLFNKYKHYYLLNKHNQTTPLMDYNNFKIALSEHDQEIIHKIDIIKNLAQTYIECEEEDDCDRCGKFRKIIRELTELKNRLALLSMPASGVLLNNTEGEPTIKEGL